MTRSEALEIFADHIAEITTATHTVDVGIGTAHGAYAFRVQGDGIPRPTDEAYDARGRIGTRVTARNRYTWEVALYLNLVDDDE